MPSGNKAPASEADGGGVGRWDKPAEWDSQSAKSFIKQGSLLLKPAAAGEAYWYAHSPAEAYIIAAPADVDPRADVAPRKLKRYANCPDGLRGIIPPFHGLRVVRGKQYIALTDLCHGMRNPAICDVKMGTRSHDPFANRAKVDLVTSKFPPQAEFGFRVVGMQLWERGEGGAGFVTARSPRLWGRRLVNWREHIELDFAARFISQMNPVQKMRLVAELKKIEEAWARVGSREIISFSSSLCIAYEAAAAIGNVDRPRPADADFDPHRIVVKMIDFNHGFYRRDHPEVDDGVLQGIQNIRRAFTSAVEERPGDPGSRASEQLPATPSGQRRSPKRAGGYATPARPGSPRSRDR